MITDVGGLAVGHWTDAEARTGCTVVLVPEGTAASAEVRGGAPASRELDLLVPGRLVDRIDAVLLTGGSAFGLAAADGVMGWLEDRGRGFATPAGPVPIVPTLGLFDLAVGSSSIRPGPAEGRFACATASEGAFAHGRVGAGTGATVGKWRGPEHAEPGGLGGATVRSGPLVVAALVAVNAYGSIDADGTGLVGVEDALPSVPPAPMGNTTIGVIATNARLDGLGCLVVAQGGHDGLGRAIVPAHTRVDGDALVAVATGEVEARLDHVRLLAVAAVERAVRALA
ncbi:P1 family peptidase [Iamia sp. SCSIO 61187]|uniref:P1 family peptidase n=1 Tax=Iamia sp. SCSIO 61187 TaxID=2722752 RepID=UPI001C62BE1C|nr:P1 family peptidase [Iamia sp. SCSIO 61187]QYG94774.1 P1 family peptidase [Iamia sp. SCSIO 61187]